MIVILGCPIFEKEVRACPPPPLPPPFSCSELCSDWGQSVLYWGTWNGEPVDWWDPVPGIGLGWNSTTEEFTNDYAVIDQIKVHYWVKSHFSKGRRNSE